MIAAFMPRHFGFCLSVGLKSSGFEFKSSLNLEQVCKNKKFKKVSFSIFHSHLNPAQTLLVAQSRTPFHPLSFAQVAYRHGLLGGPLWRPSPPSHARARACNPPARPSWAHRSA